jgi:hypothetical protein
MTDDARKNVKGIKIDLSIKIKTAFVKVSQFASMAFTNTLFMFLIASKRAKISSRCMD